MKKLFGLFLLILCLSSHSQDVNAADNSIKMAYNFTTVSQSVVFDNTMRAGGILQLSASIADGGGRSPGDPITLKLVFYNSSNTVVSTVQQSYTMTLGAAASTYSVTANNCGGSCSNVAYVSAQFYGKDGGYWAGNYGPMITSPTLTYNGGSNILYNPQFGTYSGTGYAQGWTSSAGWQNCALYSGSATCVIDNGASVNGGNYSATGGTSSGTAGGYTSQPAAPVYVSTITPTQQAHYDSMISRRNAITENSIYIDQVGSNNTVSNTQDGRYNKIAGIGSTAAPIQGDYNTVTTKQGNVGNPLGKNLIEFSIYGSYNNLNLNQGQSATDLGGHMQSVYVSGNNNSVTTNQTNNNGNYGHYLETNITGNNNTQNLTQSGNAVKKMFVNTNGSVNSLSAVQDGLGDHYLSVDMTGTGNDAVINQTGNTKNSATINLTNAGAPASITLNQSGGQTYNIDRTCTTTCARVTVTQP